VVCPACQTENKQGAKFCNECGTPLVLACPRCGASHRAGQRFCDECGLPLAGAETAPVPTEPALAPAEMRLVSVLFVDLVGFTSLSESRDAADVRELLGRYFDSARTIVERYGGTIEKFIGDAVMAVWGAPVAREDDAERAVRAALEMVDAVTVFSGEVGAVDLKARAGVVTGQVAALDNPGEGLVVGDRVNTASRVQSEAEPGSVLVDEVTRHVTSSAIAYEDAGQHTVKGKTEPLQLWRALRVVAGVGGSERAEGIEAPFVGRDGDLRLIKELFHGALERRSTRLVAVTGDAGIGKSRLRREFFNYIDGLAGTVLWHSGRCLSYGDGVAYWALAEMVRQRFGIPEEASSEETAAKLGAGLERWVADTSDREFLTPRLGALLGVAEPGLGRAELFAGWRMFLERLAEHEPVALVFEDLQWADEGLIEFIEQLLDWSASSPIFILTFARPDGERAGWPAGHRGATTLQLEPLEENSVRALLAGVVDGLPPAAADRIVEQAEGVPLYAIETVRALADRGVLMERDGRLVLDGELGELDVPASLGSLLAARLDALAPEERQLVKAMSVFGGDFPRTAAAALGGVDEAQLDGVLASLVRKQVLAIRADRLSPDRGHYAFGQGLLRTVAYDLLSRQERKTRHQAAAEHLRRAFADEGGDVAEVIANHLLDAYRAAADDPDADDLRRAAVSELRRAAQRAGTVGAPETAERNYLTALELVEDEDERVALTEAAGEMALQAARLDRAVEHLDRAAQAHTAAGNESEAARVAASLGVALIRLGRLDEAIARLTAALEVIGPDALDPIAGVLNSALARAYMWTGAAEEASVIAERALRIASALSLPDLLVKAVENKATILGMMGRAQEGRALTRLAIEVAEENGLTDELARAYTNGGSLSLVWDAPGAEEMLAKAVSLAQRRGDPYSGHIAVGNLETLYLFEGRWDELDELEAQSVGDEIGRETLAYPLVFFHAWRGRLEDARTALDACSVWKHVDDIEYRAMYATAAAAVAVIEGRSAEALATGVPAVSEVISTMTAANDSARYVWMDLMRAALDLGRLDEARQLLRLLSALPPGHIPPYLRAALTAGRALLAAAEARHDNVEGGLAATIDALRALGYPYHVALACVDYAKWLASQGRMSDADRLLAEAIATLTELDAKPALARAEAITASLSGRDPARV
jgi:class 3 adenylate cyclase/tetratricopeptide (TPR) repeat protein